MSDPIAVAEKWLSDTLEGDAELMALVPGGVHEGQGVDVDAYPFIVVNWGDAVPFNTFSDVALWTVYIQISVQTTGPATDTAAAVARVSELMASQSVTATFRGCEPGRVRRQLYPSPVTGKRETVAEYKVTLHA